MFEDKGVRLRVSLVRLSKGASFHDGADISEKLHRKSAYGQLVLGEGVIELLSRLIRWLPNQLKFDNQCDEFDSILIILSENQEIR